MQDLQSSENKEEQQVHLIYNHLLALPPMSTRYESLTQLYELREFDHFPVLFWSTFGCVASMIHEIILVYPEITQNHITNVTARRMKYVFGIMGVLSKDPETCVQIIHNRLIYLIYPFFNSFQDDPHVEYIQIAALGIMFDILTIEDDKLLSVSLNAELFDVLAKIIDCAFVLGRLVALYIFYRVISREVGMLSLFHHQTQAKIILGGLSNLVKFIIKKEEPDKNTRKMAKHLVRCYELLYEYQKRTSFPIIREIPSQLHNKFFEGVLNEDPNIIPIYQALCDGIIEKGSQDFENIKKNNLMTSVNGKVPSYF